MLDGMNLILQSTDPVMTIFCSRDLLSRQNVMHLDSSRFPRRIFLGVQSILFRYQRIQFRLINLTRRQHDGFELIVKIMLLLMQGFHVFMAFLEDFLDRIFLFRRQVHTLEKGKSTVATSMWSHGRLGMSLSHSQCTNSHSSNQKRTT